MPHDIWKKSCNAFFDPMQYIDCHTNHQNILHRLLPENYMRYHFCGLTETDPYIEPILSFNEKLLSIQEGVKLVSILLNTDWCEISLHFWLRKGNFILKLLGCVGMTLVKVMQQYNLIYCGENMLRGNSCWITSTGIHCVSVSSIHSF